VFEKEAAKLLDELLVYLVHVGFGPEFGEITQAVLIRFGRPDCETVAGLPLTFCADRQILLDGGTHKDSRVVRDRKSFTLFDLVMGRHLRGCLWLRGCLEPLIFGAVDFPPGCQIRVLDGLLFVRFLDHAADRDVCHLQPFLMKCLEHCFRIVSGGLQVLAPLDVPAQVVLTAGEF